MGRPKRVYPELEQEQTPAQPQSPDYSHFNRDDFPNPDFYPGNLHLPVEKLNLEPRKKEVRAVDPLVGTAESNSVPNVPNDRMKAQLEADSLEGVLGKGFHTFEHAKPPPADAQYKIFDQGIAGPNFLRLSMYNIPSTSTLRERTGLPLGMLVTPFAEAEVPLADFSQCPDVPRCHRCRAYINPGMQFSDDGGRFICNLCHFENDTPGWYYQPMERNRRIDWQERPELSRGTYDLILPSQYNAKAQATSPRYVFIVDCTRESLNKDIPTMTVEAIIKALYGDDNKPGGGCMPENAQIAVMSFARAIHMYRLNGRNVESLVQYDRENILIPPDIFFDPVECYERVNEWAAKFPSFLKGNWEGQSCFGAALSAGLSALEPYGGRVIIIAAALPSVQPGQLTRRDATVYGTRLGHAAEFTDPERELFIPVSTYYRNLGAKFAEQGVACDFFAFPTGYTDITNMGIVSQLSGGAHRIYPRFVAKRDAKPFINDLLNVCREPLVGSQAVVKIRCNIGLQVDNYWGIIPDQMAGVMDSQRTFAVDFKYDTALSSDHDAYFQSAVLYTDHHGLRRVRISNIPAGIADQFKSVLRFVDSDAVIGIMARQVVSKMGSSSLEELRHGIMQKVYEIFGNCRGYAGGALPPSQLLMPTSLRQFLPLTNALIKCVAIGERAFMCDTRMDYARGMIKCNADQLTLLLYPRIYSVADLVMYEDDPVHWPTVSARSSELSGGCYLLFNGVSFTLFVSQSVPVNLIEDLFDTKDVSQISAYINELPVLETEVSKRFHILCDYLASRVGRLWLPLQLAREELDGAEFLVLSMMVEDRQEIPAYPDYVALVHREAKRAVDLLEKKSWY